MANQSVYIVPNSEWQAYESKQLTDDFDEQQKTLDDVAVLDATWADLEEASAEEFAPLPFRPMPLPEDLTKPELLSPTGRPPEKPSPTVWDQLRERSTKALEQAVPLTRRPESIGEAALNASEQAQRLPHFFPGGVLQPEIAGGPLTSAWGDPTIEGLRGAGRSMRRAGADAGAGDAERLADHLKNLFNLEMERNQARRGLSDTVRAAREQWLQTDEGKQFLLDREFLFGRSKGYDDLLKKYEDLGLTAKERTELRAQIRADEQLDREQARLDADDARRMALEERDAEREIERSDVGPASAQMPPGREAAEAGSRRAEGVVGESGLLGGKVGAETEAFGIDDPNQAYRFRFRVVSLDDLVASQSDPRSLTPNPNFPAELQPRSRDRAASQMQIERLAREINPAILLDDAHQIDHGAMIVGSDGIVESGNGRALALQLARAEFPEKWSQYQQALRAAVGRYGFSPQDLRSIKDPVLVRERITPVDRTRFVAEANGRATLAMAPLEQARVDAGRLSDDAVGNITVGDGQSMEQALRSAGNRDLVRAFMGTVPDNERAELLDADGLLNRVGLARLRAALFAKAYPGPAGQALGDTLLESLDAGTKNIESAVFASLPKIAQAESLIRAGARDSGLSITEDVAHATNVLARLRQQGISVEEYLAQGSFLEKELNTLQEQLLQHLDALHRSPRQMRAFFEEYADAVIAMPHPSQGEMFESVRPRKEDILARSLGAAKATPESLQEGLPFIGDAAPPRVVPEAPASATPPQREGLEDIGGGVSGPPPRETARGGVTPPPPDKAPPPVHPGGSGAEPPPPERPPPFRSGRTPSGPQPRKGTTLDEQLRLLIARRKTAAGRMVWDLVADLDKKIADKADEIRVQGIRIQNEATRGRIPLTEAEERELLRARQEGTWAPETQRDPIPPQAPGRATGVEIEQTLAERNIPPEELEAARLRWGDTDPAIVEPRPGEAIPGQGLVKPPLGTAEELRPSGPRVEPLGSEPIPQPEPIGSQAEPIVGPAGPRVEQQGVVPSLTEWRAGRAVRFDEAIRAEAAATGTTVEEAAAPVADAVHEVAKAAEAAGDPVGRVLADVVDALTPQTFATVGENAETRAVRLAGQKEIQMTREEQIARMQLPKLPDALHDVFIWANEVTDFGAERRRGVHPKVLMEKLANWAGRTYDEYMKLPVGSTMNQEQAGALINATTAKAAEVKRLREAIAALGPGGITDDAVAALSRSEEELVALTSIFSGVKAEWGRAGHAFQRIARDYYNPVTAAAAIYKRFGGKEEFLKALAEYDAMIERGANPAEMAKFFKRIRTIPPKNALHRMLITADDWFKMVGYSSMLSGPRTFVVNTAGSAENILWRQLSDGLWDVMRVRPDRVKARVLGAIQGGWWGREGAGGQAFMDTLRYGISSGQAEHGALPQGIAATRGGVQGKIALALGEGMLRGQGATDAYFISIGYNMQRGSIAADVVHDAGLKGKAANTEWKRLMQEGLTPAQEAKAWRDGMRLAYHGEIKGPVGETLLTISRKMPFFGNIVLPFVPTLYHGMRRGMDLTPVVGHALLAADYALGRYGKRRLGKTGEEIDPVHLPEFGERARDVGMGATALGGWLYAKALEGNISASGPEDKAEREALMATGWRPYSVRLPAPWLEEGHAWVGYGNWLGWSLPLAQTAAIAEALKYAKPGGSTVPVPGGGSFPAPNPELFGDFVGRWARVVEDMTLLRGMLNFVQMWDNPDARFERFLGDLVTREMPYGSLLNTVGQVQDPYGRNPQPRGDVGEYLGQRIQARSLRMEDREQVPPDQTALGGDKPTLTTGPAAVSPFRVSPEIPSTNLDPIQLELYDHKVYPRLVDKKIGNTMLTEEQQYEFQQTVGDKIRAGVAYLQAKPFYVDANGAEQKGQLEGVLRTALRYATELFEDRGIVERTPKTDIGEPLKWGRTPAEEAKYEEARRITALWKHDRASNPPPTQEQHAWAYSSTRRGPSREWQRWNKARQDLMEKTRAIMKAS